MDGQAVSSQHRCPLTWVIHGEKWDTCKCLLTREKIRREEEKICESKFLGSALCVRWQEQRKMFIFIHKSRCRRERSRQRWSFSARFLFFELTPRRVLSSRRTNTRDLGAKHQHKWFRGKCGTRKVAKVGIELCALANRLMLGGRGLCFQARSGSLAVFRLHT